MLEKYKTVVDNKKTFGALLIDLSKPFDCLSHDLLLAKLNICGAFRDLVAFVQFKKREKHLQRRVNFSKVAGFSLQLY